jgi:hypothetical protein
MRRWLLSLAKAVLPDRFVEWYRRRRALHRYLEAMSYEVYHRQVRLDRSDLEDLEDRVSARRDGFYQQMVKDVLERTDLVLQQLDRKIEGVSARQARELRALRAEIEDLRADLAGLDVATRAVPVGDAAVATPLDR